MSTPTQQGRTLRRSTIASGILLVLLLLLGGAVRLGLLGDRHSDSGPVVPPAPAVIEPAAKPGDLEARATGDRQSLERASEGTHLGALLVRVLDEATRDPLPGLGVEVASVEHGDPFLGGRLGFTDAGGAVRFDDLTAGRVMLRVYNGAKAEAVVIAALCTEVLILSPETVRVTGFTLDIDGNPVPGAQVWISGTGNSTLMRQLTTSDAAGRFELRHIAKSHWLAAVHPRFLRSPQARITALPGDTQQLVLRFPAGAPARLEGVVRAADDQRGLAATVELVPVPSYLNNDRLGGIMDGPEVYSQRVATSDGTFRFFGIEPGAYNVEVRATDFVTQAREVVLGSVVMPPLEFALQPGLMLEGNLVSDRTGLAVLRGHISIAVEGARGGTAGFADERGHFVLRGIPPGVAHVFAQSADSGILETRIDTQMAAKTPSRFVLSRGLEVFGKVVARTGELPTGLRIGLRPAHAKSGVFDSIVDIAPDGGFSMPNCSDAALELVLLAPGGSGSSSVEIATVPDVRPGTQSLLVQFDPAWMPTAWLLVRIVTEDGSEVPGAVLMVGNENSKTMHRIEARQSVARIGPLCAGEYEVEACGVELGTQWLEPVSLRAGATHDLGVVVLRPCGRIQVSVLAAAEASRPGIIRYVLRDSRGRAVAQPWTSELLVDFKRLTQGEYTLECLKGDRVVHTQAIHVQAGETVRVEVDLRPK